jgi:hypothetical protein
MKKMIRNTASVLFTALVATAFAGCSNDESVINNTGKDGEISALLKFNFSDAQMSRSVGAAVGTTGNKALTISNASVIFYKENGMMTGQIQLVPDAQKDEAAGKYSITAAQNPGITVKDLNVDTKRVAVIANTTPSITTGDFWTNSTGQAIQTLEINSQKSEGTINIYGSDIDLADVTPTGSGDDDNKVYAAEVTIAPTVARFEITDLKAGGIFKSFDVLGVFMDDFYNEARVDADLTGNNEINKASTDGTLYAENSNKYPTADKGATYDVPATGTTWTVTNAAVYAPTFTPTGGAATTGVWGYYAFAAPYTKTFDHKTGGSAVPTMILHLGNFKLKDDASAAAKTEWENGKKQFVTVKGFMVGTGTSAYEVQSIKAGYVYATTTGSFVVDEDKTTDNPHEKEIDVKVTVTPIEWSRVDVSPII